MLSAVAKKALFKSLPTTYSINGTDINVLKTFGNHAPEAYENPVVNLNVITEGIKRYTSIDRFEAIVGNILSYSCIDTARFRFTVAANDFNLTNSEVFTFDSAETDYDTTLFPIISIESVYTSSETFTEGTDYSVSYYGITWLGANTPVHDESFTIEFTYTERGYWITTQIIEDLYKYIECNFNSILSDYNSSLTSIESVTDLTDIVGPDIVSACAFDITINYRFTWDRELTDNDGPVLSGIDLDLSGSNYLEEYEIR